MVKIPERIFKFNLIPILNVILSKMVVEFMTLE
jgi:hypothetical protein